MRSILNNGRAFAGLMLVALLLVASGCASDRESSPTAPSAPTLSEPVWAYPNPVPADGAELGLLDWLLQVIRSVVMVVLPNQSAVLEGDIYRLDIPAGALPRRAVYSMTYQAGGPAQVTLGPHGAQFNVPVQLSIDLSGTSLADAPDVTLYWWDENNGEWVDVGGVWDPSTGAITSQLEHFSRYRPGRAGW